MMFSCCHPRLSEEAQAAWSFTFCARSTSTRSLRHFSPRALPRRSGSGGQRRCSPHRAASSIWPTLILRRNCLQSIARCICCSTKAITVRRTKSAVRIELCEEALHLTSLLVEHSLTSTPATLALAAVMCLHSARIPARIESSGNLNSLVEQDRSRWNRRLIAEGRQLLDRSATGVEVTEYHIEAAIASLHASAASIGASRTQTGAVSSASTTP